jgi:hypothetical protein
MIDTMPTHGPLRPTSASERPDTHREVVRFAAALAERLDDLARPAPAEPPPLPSVRPDTSREPYDLD